MLTPSLVLVILELQKALHTFAECVSSKISHSRYVSTLAQADGYQHTHTHIRRNMCVNNQVCYWYIAACLMCEFEMDIAHMTHMHFFKALKGLISFLIHGVGSQPWLPKKQLQGGLQTPCDSVIRFFRLDMKSGRQWRASSKSRMLRGLCRPGAQFYELLSPGTIEHVDEVQRMKSDPVLRS